MKIQIKFLNGDLLHLTGSSLQDAIPAVAEYFHLSYASLRLQVKEVIQDIQGVQGDNEEKKENTLYGFAFLLPKTILALPSLFHVRHWTYHFLIDCVNESLLHHVFHVLDDLVTSASIDEDGQTLENMIWRCLVKNPHPLVVDRIFARNDLEIWNYRQGLSANPSDRVLDFLFEHPERIYPQTMLLNRNPRAIDWIIQHVDPHAFEPVQYQNAMQNFQTRESIEWLIKHFSQNAVIMQCLAVSGCDAWVDFFLEHNPNPNVLLPQSTRSELVPYYLEQLNLHHTLSPTDVSFIAKHPDPRITDWIIQNMNQHVEPDKTIYLEHLYAKPNEDILEWLTSADNPHITPAIRRWQLGLNSLPRAQTMYREILENLHQVPIIINGFFNDVQDVQAILWNGTIEMISITMDALVTNDLPREHWLNAAFEGLSRTNEWESEFTQE